MVDQITFDKFSIEILLEIFSYLSPETLAKSASLNKKLYIATRDNLFWHEKLKRHFPHIRVEINNETNCYAEFRKAYDAEYKDLPTPIKKLFSLVKECDIASLVNVLKLSDLNQSDKNGYSLFKWAKKINNQTLLDYFYQLACQEYEAGFTVDTMKTDSHGRTILHWAILCHQSANEIDLLILQGSAIDALANDRSPLSRAAEHGHVELTERLIHHGANINLRSSKGATPLLFAIEKGHNSVVHVLLKHNADTSIPLESNGKYHRHFKVKAGDTPLHAASKLGSIAIVRKLLENNANIEAVNNKKQLPADVAIKDSKYGNELKLLTYSIGVNRRQDNHFKTSFTLFGHSFNFGCYAKQKKDATNALKSVIFDGADQSCLDIHQESLNNGELKEIYLSLIPRF